MTVEGALYERRSTRVFADKSVPLSLVRDLLEASRWTPSGGNLQPWKVKVVSGSACEAVINLACDAIKLGRPSEEGEHSVYPADLSTPYRDRRFKVGEDMYAILGIRRDDKPARLGWLTNNYRFFGAPIGLFFIIERGMGHGQWAHLGMFMQSLMLMATERGLATCPQEAWVRFRGQLHGYFQLNADELVYCGMALGYAADHPVNAMRSDRAEVDEFAEFLGV
ncbi:nitroreductase [Blastomonas sp. UPD001]|uniref:nitroreductase n=1 Tax=Blastomonas sp. UPD001 TaxID=2217673 RepID=UPI000E344936|nr:nitroreductase [Blastomonas sp. UPD001]